MIAIGTIPTEDIEFEALLQRFEIFNMGPHDLPECLNAALERFGFRQRWLKVPGIVTVAGRSWAAALTLAMNVRWLDSEPLTDLLKRNVVPVNAQRRAEAK